MFVISESVKPSIFLQMYSMIVAKVKTSQLDS